MQNKICLKSHDKEQATCQVRVEMSLKQNSPVPDIYHVQHLPIDLLRYIFSFCPLLCTIKVVHRVCKSFHVAANSAQAFPPVLHLCVYAPFTHPNNIYFPLNKLQLFIKSLQGQQGKQRLPFSQIVTTNLCIGINSPLWSVSERKWFTRLIVWTEGCTEKPKVDPNIELILPSVEQLSLPVWSGTDYLQNILFCKNQTMPLNKLELYGDALDKADFEYYNTHGHTFPNSLKSLTLGNEFHVISPDAIPNIVQMLYPCQEKLQHVTISCSAITGSAFAELSQSFPNLKTLHLTCGKGQVLLSDRDLLAWDAKYRTRLESFTLNEVYLTWRAVKFLACTSPELKNLSFTGILNGEWSYHKHEIGSIDTDSPLWHNICDLYPLLDGTEKYFRHKLHTLTLKMAAFQSPLVVARTLAYCGAWLGQTVRNLNLDFDSSMYAEWTLYSTRTTADTRALVTPKQKNVYSLITKYFTHLDRLSVGHLDANECVALNQCQCIKSLALNLDKFSTGCYGLKEQELLPFKNLFHIPGLTHISLSRIHWLSAFKDLVNLAKQSGISINVR